MINILCLVKYFFLKSFCVWLVFVFVKPSLVFVL